MTHKTKMPEPVILRTVMPDDYRYGHVYGYTRKHMEAYADARVRESQHWISVETLLPPDDGKEVLAIHSDGEVEIVYGHLILETHCDRAYTHWMPMPDHPTVE